MVHFAKRRFCLVAAFMSMLTCCLSAQVNSGSIQGVATDATGAVVVGAPVTATNTATGSVSSTTTLEAGNYIFPDLPAGLYKVSVSQTGFRPAIVNNIALDAASTRTVNFSLSPGAANEAIEVTGTEQQVNTSSGDLSSVVEGKRIETLQLNGRNYIQLVNQLPGAISTNLDPFTSATGNASGNVVTINGIRGTSVYTSMDGIALQDPENDAAAIGTPGVDTIAETRVLTADYGAEYYSHGGAIVNVITKTGTRQFHGNAFEFVRNDDLDAKSAFALVRQSLHFNDFGFTLGGPIFIPGKISKDTTKFFFFVGEEWKRIVTAAVSLNVVPTPSQLNGIFPTVTAAGAVGPKVFQPGTKIPYTTCPQQPSLAGTGYCVPTTAFSPNGIAELGLYNNTVPNYSVAGSASNFSYNPITYFDVREDRVNLNYDATARSTFSLKYDHTDVFQQLPVSLIPGQRHSYPRISNFAIADFTHIFSDSFVNDFSVGLTSSQFYRKDDTSPFLRSKLGVTYPEIYGNNPLGLGLAPGLTITGYAGVTIPIEAEHEDHVLAIHDDVSKIVKKHQLKFGIFTGFSTDYENEVPTTVNGLVTFTGSSTVPLTTGNALGDAIVGNFATYQEQPYATSFSSRFNIFDLYAQDSWKASSRLTFVAGVRYTFPQTNYNTYNSMSTFIPSSFVAALAPAVSKSTGALSGNYNVFNGIALPGSGFPSYASKVIPASVLSNPAVTGLFSNLPRGFAPTPKTDVAPRLGFALDVFGDGKTSIRGGFGLFFDRTIHLLLQAPSLNPPFNTTTNISNGSFDNPAGGGISIFPSSLYGLPLHFDSPVIEAVNLSVQHQFPLQLIAQVAYVGTLGKHLPRVLNINQLQPGTVQANPGVNQNALRPYLGYSDIDMLTFEDTTNYHALQATLNRRVSKGITIGASYTFSKMMESSSSPTTTLAGSLPQNSYNPRAEYGIADLNRPEVFSFNGIWTLPFFLHGNALERYTIGGWTLTGVLSMQSGPPVNVALSSDNEGIGTSTSTGSAGTVANPVERPNLTGSPRLAASQRTLTHWFNTTAYSSPMAGTLGNAGRNALVGPGYTQTDLSVHKEFPIEKVTVQFRAEAFNAWNHTNYTTVGSTFGTSTFGQLTASTPGRVLQFALKATF